MAAIAGTMTIATIAQGTTTTGGAEFPGLTNQHRTTNEPASSQLKIGTRLSHVAGLMTE